MVFADSARSGTSNDPTRGPRVVQVSEPVAERVEVRPVDNALEADLARVRKLATLLDSQFEIAGIRFGWDSIIGLIPGAGDLITGGIALYPLYIARKHRLGTWTLMRMAANVGADALVGAVPVVGDAFDVVFKANKKNLALLEKAARKRGSQGTLVTDRT